MGYFIWIIKINMYLVTNGFKWENSYFVTVVLNSLYWLSGLQKILVNSSSQIAQDEDENLVGNIRFAVPIILDWFIHIVPALYCDNY